MTWHPDAPGDPEPPIGGAPPAPATHRPLGSPRVRAVLQVLLCSGIPTQLLIVQVLALLGHRPFLNDERLNITWVFVLSLTDTVLLVGLILLILRYEGESAREVFLGWRRPATEIPLGIVTVIPLLLLTTGLILLVRWLAPWLHNVPINPFAQLLQSPTEAWLFAVVALVGGGVREELQRAFLITRFERHLGGATVGLLVTSAAFGVGHVVQGLDAGIATAVLGLIWGAMYLWRRSVLASVTSHAGFNGQEILRYLLIGPGSV
ncbi:MAG TPA: CPBP family intramembrane glutamic endopeptidase [Vicinamibacterales bacterium]